MKKKALDIILAVVAIVAIVLCIVFAGQRGDKADVVTDKINKAVEEAKNAAAGEKDEALAAVTAAADEAVKAAQEAAAAEKAELEGQIADLTAKLGEAEEAAKAAAETAGQEKDNAIAEAKAAGEEALKAAEDAAAAVKAELEGKVEEAKAAGEKAVTEAKEAGEKALAEAQEAAEKVKTELEEKVKGLEEELAAAAEKVKDGVTDAVEEVKDAVEEKAEEAKDAVEEVKDDAEEKAEEVKEAIEEKADEAKEAVEDVAAEAAVMSYADYDAAELDSAVTVETYVQATQSWWDGKITIYAQSEDGAYFIYNAACTEEDAAKLVPGTKIKVSGFKAEWSGEVEIIDATIEILEGDAFIAEPHDDTELLGKEDELIKHQNEKVAFKGLTVAAQDDGAAFNYKNAENKTDDLYIRFTKDDVTVNFCVEFYLCGNDTDVYKAVEGLQVGDVVDVEGFLYWYNGANVHLTAVTKAE